jgi:hypothetical protein
MWGRITPVLRGRSGRAVVLICSLILISTLSTFLLFLGSGGDAAALWGLVVPYMA